MTDYVKMWEDLGMDLANHDLLCQVLPTAVGDVFMTQENRPKAMDFWDMVIAEVHGIRPAELIEAQKQGRKVFGTFCVYVPDEVVIAANGIVTGLCGGSQFWVPGGETVLPKNTCPLIKASVGARLGRTCPFFRIADMYVGETTCDGKKKAYEILGEDVPMYIMDVPQMKREQDILKWKDEIAAFARKVEEFTGNPVTPEKLGEAIRIVNEKRRALKRVYDARKALNLPISGRDALLMMQISFFDDPQRCAQMCNRLADELEQRIRDGVSVVPAGTKRILLTGTPLAVPNWKLHNIIETSGGVVVCEEMCTGTRYFENEVEEDGTTLDEQFLALSRRYLKNNCACFTPNEGRVADILRLAEEYHADGVIDCSLKFCTLYDMEKYQVTRALKDAGIPVLSLETDYEDSDAGQLRTRIEAFIEMLNQA
ncbi:MAG: 2-hydroxyacyl-CoA dehydratase family protein [Clostridia bacterium]|nr:2-hydroxyacyl-CoA dehydratase family protein [Clostridia bacterium]